ncbi:MAG: helix-turn-helix domain-containing protein [Chthoniobacterales bacterium]
MDFKNPKSVFPPADWQALRISVDRCYEGIPVGKSGTFSGTVATLCEMRSGHLDMQRDGLAIRTNARSRPWVINIPGKRTQHFSDKARILSVHLSLSNPENGAEWNGLPMVLVYPDSAAKQALQKLQQTVQEIGLSTQELEMRGHPLSLPDALALQIAGTKLFAHILRLVHPHGMRFEVPTISDQRVYDSHLLLAAMPVQIEFSRKKLAMKQGLTAGQLDRLWRKELGLTPQQYRDRQRFTFACEQLRRPAIPIKAIAADLGFRHLSQFSNWFRTRHNESPRSFRNRPNVS